MRSFKKNLSTVAVGILLVSLPTSGIFRAMEMYGNDREITCTVADVDRKLNSDKDGTSYRYMVHTEECGTIQIKGGFQWGTFFPGAKARSLQEGTTYTFEVAGERNEMLFAYPTVKGIYEVDRP